MFASGGCTRIQYEEGTRRITQKFLLLHEVPTVGQNRNTTKGCKYSFGLGTAESMDACAPMRSVMSYRVFGHDVGGIFETQTRQSTPSDAAKTCQLLNSAKPGDRLLPVLSRPSGRSYCMDRDKETDTLSCRVGRSQQPSW